MYFVSLFYLIKYEMQCLSQKKNNENKITNDYKLSSLCKH